VTTVQQPDPGLTWFTVDDFRPGIYSQSNFAFGSADNLSPVPVIGLGQNAAAAQAEGTYACLALPSGGLGPLPGIKDTYTAPAGAVSNGVTNWLTGMTTYGRMSGGSDEIVYGIENVTANQRTQYVIVLDPQTGYNTAIITKGPATSTVGSLSYAVTAALTMANASDNTGVTTGTAVLAITSSFINDAAPLGGTPWLFLYPDPTDPGGTTAPKDYSAYLPATGTGVVLAHQNRIVILQQNEYPWTNAIANKVLAGEFEHFYYTDPPNTVPGNGNPDSLTQNEVFVQEWPLGVGCYGSISAGELFCVKHNGGGFIVSGDLNNPTVTWLGGVTPTYNLNATAVSTPIGMVYLSNANGLWAWNGSNTSQKISVQLNDDFYIIPDPLPSIGPTYNLVVWAELFMVPNNYLFDTTTGGWWKLDNQTVPFAWYGVAYDGSSLYAMPSNVTQSTQPVVYQYSQDTPANVYSWKSYPIPKSIDRMVEVQECAVRAQGNGMVTLTFTADDGSSGPTQPASATFSTTTRPVLQRQVVATTGYDVTVTITSTGTGGGPAPVVYGFSVGFLETTPVNPT
jgi:hypothetical protein